MFKCLFFSENPKVFREYALRLEEHNIDYWAATTYTDCESLVRLLGIDILFLDYKMFDHKVFNVREYLKSKTDKIVLLYMNCKDYDPDYLLEHWQDEASMHHNNLFSVEMNEFLHIVTGRKLEYLDSIPPTKMRDLDRSICCEICCKAGGGCSHSLVKIEETDKIEMQHKTEETECCSSQYSCKQEKKLSDNRNIEINYQSKKEYSSIIDFFNNTTEDSLLSKYALLRKKYKMTFEELQILDLFFKNQGKTLAIEDIMNVIWPNSEKRNVDRIYSYIHSLRNILAQENSDINLLRVKKGAYSLFIE
ncbi:MAG: helix-turn-helix domain-containing protein [Treponema sp.]|nr:helix-turn-helix domain-containing protein [Treponema sp.]